MFHKAILCFLVLYFTPLTHQDYVIGDEISAELKNLWDEFRNFIKMISDGLQTTFKNGVEFVKKEEGRFNELGRTCLEVVRSDNINFKQFVLNIKAKAEEANLDIEKCLEGIDKIENSTTITNEAVEKIVQTKIDFVYNRLQYYENVTNNMVFSSLPAILKDGSMCGENFDCYQDLNPAIKTILFNHYARYLSIEQACASEKGGVFQKIYQAEKRLADEIKEQVLFIRKCYDELSNKN